MMTEQEIEQEAIKFAQEYYINHVCRPIKNK